jgi:penicillin-binding protein 1B
VLSNTTPIRRITNSNGVNVVDTKPDTRPVIKPEIAWLMTSLMQDVMTRGTAARAKSLASIAAGKTGTSRDGWFAGYTSNIVCVVWVGFDDNSELGLEGAKSALPIWLSFMNQALKLRPDLAGNGFTKPEGIVESEIDPATGLLASPLCPQKRIEYFIQGTEPKDICAAPAGDHTAANAHPKVDFGDDELPSDRPRRVTPEDPEDDRDKKDDKKDETKDDKKKDKKKDDKKDGKNKDDHL